MECPDLDTAVATYTQAQASITQARVALAKAKSDYDRTKLLVDKGASGFREPSAIAVVSKLAGTDGVHIQLHQRADGRGKLVIEFADTHARDAALQRLGVFPHHCAAPSDAE